MNVDKQHDTRGVRIGPSKRGYAGLVMAAWLGAACSQASVPAFDFGPVAAADRSLSGEERLRAGGPFFERRIDGEQRRFLALRPFYSSTTETLTPRHLQEFLWPWGMNKERCGEVDWRFLPAFGHDFDGADSLSRYRYSLFPLVFGGRDKDGEDYLAVFPLGGTLHEFLGFDRIAFVLFPLYVQSSAGDVRSRSFLWPILSWTTGERVRRFRVFPFYGESLRAGEWEKRFVLWPLWTSAEYYYPESTGKGFILFPLFGHIRLTDQETWMVIPPLFRWTRGRMMNKGYFPWPFVQTSSGAVDKLYLWPLWGHKTMPGAKSSFLLWPIGHHETVTRPNEVINRTFVLPLWFYESRVSSAAAETPSDAVHPDGGGEAGDALLPAGPSVPTNRPAVSEPVPAAAGAVLSRYVQLWPLVSYRREAEESRLRVLDLWPGKHPGAVDRNLAPLWTLYERNRIGEVREHEWLWGLVRWRSMGDGERGGSIFPLLSWRRAHGEIERREWSFLLGLAGYQREGLRKSCRLLYFLRWSGGRDAETPEAAAGE